MIILLNKRLFALILTQRQAVYHIKMRKRTKELQRQALNLQANNPKMHEMESVQSHTHDHDNKSMNGIITKTVTDSMDISSDHDHDHQDINNNIPSIQRQDSEDIELERREIEMNERQLMLIQVITKLSALFGIFVPDGILIVIIGIIAFSLKTQIMDFIFWTVFTIGHMIGSLCFFCTLSLNESWFNILCSKCNKFCVNICSGLAKKSMEKREEYGDSGKSLDIEYWD